MAYLANDPNKEMDDKNVGMNVINPTDGGQSTDTSSDGQNQPQTAPTAGSGTITASAPQGGQTAPQSAQRRPSEGGKGSSGRFTNIRKYIQANQPQATKMAGAAGAQTQKQAQAIGQQVKQQQDKLEEQIKQNQAKMGQAQKFADQQLWLAGGMQPESRDYQKNQQRIADYEKSYLGDKYQEYFEKSNEIKGLNPDGSQRLSLHYYRPEYDAVKAKEREANLQALKNEYFGEGQYGKLRQEDVSRFRQLATGQEKFQDVQNMNLAQQQVAARRLQQQAAQAGTEQGRRGLLKQAFGEGGRQYTRGQQGLDELIVSGSAEAREQLAQQTQQAAEAAKAGIRQAQIGEARDIAGLQQAGEQFQRGLQEQATEGAKNIVTEANAALAAAQEARKAQLEKFGAVESGLQARMDKLKSMFDMGNIENRRRLMKDLKFSDMPKTITLHRPYGRSKTIPNPKYEAVQEFIRTGDRNALVRGRVKHHMGGQHLDKYLRQSVLGELSGYGKDLELLGINPRAYTGSFDAEYNTAGRKSYHNTAYGTDIGDLITGSKGRKWLDSWRVLDEFSALNKKLGAFSAEDLFQKQLGDIQGGLSLKEFREGADLTRESVVDPNQIAKYQALSQLAGTSGDQLLQEKRGDALTQEEFDKYLESIGKI